MQISVFPVKVEAFSLAFKRLRHTRHWLCDLTSCLTCSPYTHVEPVITVVCTTPPASCWVCGLKQQHADSPHTRHEIKNEYNRSHHTLSFRVTGIKGEDSVKLYIDSKFSRSWDLVSVPTNSQDGYKTLEFLCRQVGRPFDHRSFYFDNIMPVCWPWPAGCPLMHDYNRWTGGWVCSSLCTAALSVLDFSLMNSCMGMDPCRVSPGLLARSVAKSEPWIKVRSVPCNDRDLYQLQACLHDPFPPPDAAGWHGMAPPCYIPIGSRKTHTVASDWIE